MKIADITILGSGAAGSLTLLAVFEKLLNNTDASRKLHITVVERTGEFWKGVPYGKRSSVNALTITSVLDFIYEPERPAFFAWLKANIEDWSGYYRANGGITAERWLANNLPLIEKDAWDEVYIPRYLFGNYLNEKVNRNLKIIEELQLANVTLIQAEAIDVTPEPNGRYEVILEFPDKSTSILRTHKLIIATGSAPVKKMCELASDSVTYINDIYEPSVAENIELLREGLKNTPAQADKNILLIGSNASSIEMLYLLEGLPDIRSEINEVVIISTSGALPVHISTENLDVFPIPHLEKIKANGKYNIKTLSEAAGKDIKLALANGANMDYVAVIVNNTLNLMEELGEQAKKEFYCIYGVKLRDSFRRSGPEYKGCAKVMEDAGQVKMVKGKFINAESAETGVVMHYTDTETNLQQAYPEKFVAIINCTGSADLDSSSSRLLYNLVNNKVCTMNLSGKGIEVNDKFEAAPNLYVMGPLLGGNVNKRIHFWQLENVARLSSLVPYLAEELVVPAKVVKSKQILAKS